MKTIRPPKGLKPAGKKFWKKVLSEYEFEETHDFERLAMAAKCLDDVAEVEETLKPPAVSPRIDTAALLNTRA